MNALAVFLALSSLCGEPLPDAKDYLAGHSAQSQGKYADAAQAFSACASQEGPLASFAMIRAASSRAKAGDLDGAIQALREVIEKQPDGPWVFMAWAELAELLKDRKAYEEAVPMFTALLVPPLQPPWMSRYRWDAASCKVLNPAGATEGFSAFAELLQDPRHRRDRVEAADQLALSPDPNHRFLAAEALLDAGSHKKVSLILISLKASVAAGAEDKTRCDYIEGRVLLATGQAESGRKLLQSVIEQAPKTVWARKSQQYIARSLLCAEHIEAGEKALDQLLADYPDTPESGDELWWWANRLAESEKIQDAIRQYLRLAEVCPSHERADRALLTAGDLLRLKAELKKAIECYRLLAERYPRSSYASQALFRSGRLMELLADRDGAAKAYRAAADGPVGDFYVHRASARLTALDKTSEPPGRVIDTGLNAAFLRTKPLPAAEPDDPPNELLDTPWRQRLSFFGAHGLEEAEWEAFHIGQTLKDAPEARHIFHLLADAGLGATTAFFAEALHWGEKDGALDRDRLRVEFPRAYWPEVQAVAKETGLDPYLILAMARQESLFQARVVSSAGAVGVMQIMPGTAKWLARVEPATPPDAVANLADPAVSLRLGAYYLMRMLERADGNLVYSVASYNGGPGNVGKWRGAKPTSDMDAFIESIPFTETRAFVVKVLGNYAAYRSIYDSGL